MNKKYFNFLALFSDSIRESTISRLKVVPEGMENFRVTSSSLSIADIAFHIAKTDRIILKSLETGYKGRNLGRPGMKNIRSRKEYDRILKELAKLGIKRRDTIISLNDKKFRKKISVCHLKGKTVMEFGELLYMMLDHEIHHRGQLSVYLKLLP